jgi:multiple sugar transport system permease protein
VRHLGGILLLALVVPPLLLMVSGSLRRAGLPPPRAPELVPSPLSPGNYARALELVDLGRYAANSLLVAAVAVPLAVIVASWAAFAIARLGRRAAGALLVVSLAALMVPVTALLVPRFVLFRAAGLTDTYVPLVAPALLGMSPFYVLVYYWAFRRVPRDLFDAARLEGASALAVWWRVAMPLVRPVTVAVAVLAFALSWSSFVEPLIYLFDERLYTLPLGLKSLAQLDRLNFPVLLAGSVIATAPVVVLFIVAQRWLPSERRGAGWLGR